MQFVVRAVGRIMFGRSISKIIIIILSSANLKIKILIIKLKKLVLLCQHKLHPHLFTSSALNFCLFMYIIVIWKNNYIRRYVKSVLWLFRFATIEGWSSPYNKKFSCLRLRTKFWGNLFFPKTGPKLIKNGVFSIFWKTLSLTFFVIYIPSQTPYLP